jgi:hypothetical protein
MNFWWQCWRLWALSLFVCLLLGQILLQKFDILKSVWFMAALVSLSPSQKTCQNIVVSVPHIKERLCTLRCVLSNKG